MKNKINNTISIIFVINVSLFIFSCGNSTNEGNQKTESGSDIFKNQGPAYDRNKIDPKAAVIEVTLVTSGNTMSDMKFNLDTILIKSGCTVHLVLKNGSTDLAMMHNFVLVDTDAVQQVADAGVKAGKDKNFVPDVPDVYVATKLTMPGEIDSIRFPAPPVGVYKFICTYPGHYSKMQGWFLVE